MERRLKERDEAEEKREAERRALQKRKKEKEKQLRDKEHATAVEKHKRRYKCHIAHCSTSSTGPTYVAAHTEYRSGANEDWGESRNEYIEAHYEWDNPKNLHKCTICGKWACMIHINMGVCEECFKKGYMPGDKSRGPFIPMPMIILPFIGAGVGYVLQNVPLAYGLAIIGLVVGYVIKRTT